MCLFEVGNHVVDPGEGFRFDIITDFTFKFIHNLMVKKLVWAHLLQQLCNSIFLFGGLALRQFNYGLCYLADDVFQLVRCGGNTFQLFLHHLCYLKTIHNLLCCFYILG